MGCCILVDVTNKHIYLYIHPFFKINTHIYIHTFFYPLGVDRTNYEYNFSKLSTIVAVQMIVPVDVEYTCIVHHLIFFPAKILLTVNTYM